LEKLQSQYPTTEPDRDSHVRESSVLPSPTTLRF